MPFDYALAFARNEGFISRGEQARLRQTKVALAGMGGVGGNYLAALARLGVGRFIIADGDRFELANFNRQYGASLPTLGRNKARVMAEVVQSINPEATVEIWERHVADAEFPQFLAGADVVVDGIEIFAVQAHRALHRAARQAGLPVVMAAPLGFGSTLHVFTAAGMAFDTYFDFADSQDELEQIVNFVLGLAPAGLHLPYIDLACVDLEAHQGPSTSAGCMISAGMVATAAVALALQRDTVRSAPFFAQFDSYRLRLRTGYLWRGNRNLLQRIKKWFLLRRLRQQQSRNSAAPGLRPCGACSHSPPISAPSEF